MFVFGSGTCQQYGVWADLGLMYLVRPADVMCELAADQ